MLSISLGLSLTSLAARRGGGASYNPVAVFGADLVTWYGNSVDDLWQAQSTGGAVTLYQDNAGSTPVTALEQTVGQINDLSGNGYHLRQSTASKRARLSARYNQLLATDTLSTQSITTIAASQRLTFSGAGSITLSGTATGTYSAGTHTITTTAGTLTLTVSGSVTNADFRFSACPSSWPVYQRVTTASDYDTVGFPCHLLTDGIDDSYETANIDLSSTSSAFVLVSVLKTFDGAERALVEHGSNFSSAGFWQISAPGFSSGINGYAFGLRGSASASVLVSSVLAPHAAVLSSSLIRDNITPGVTARINGTQVGVSGTVSSGSLGGFPLYVAGRAGTSIFFRGGIFSLPMIVKRIATAGEIPGAEKAFGKAIGVLQ